MAECGGNRLVERGAGNASAADLFDEFDQWEDGLLSKLGAIGVVKKAHLSVEIASTTRQDLLRHEFLQSATVISNIIINRGGTDVKRHIVFRLPSEMTYRTGDYLGLLPTNPFPTVQRVLNRFHLHADDSLTLDPSATSMALPVGTPIAAFALFAGFVELSQPISIKQLGDLASLAEGGEKNLLERYVIADVYTTEVAGKRMSVLDILEEVPDLELPIGDFILMLPALRMRQVSVCSENLTAVLYLFVRPGRSPRSFTHSVDPGSTACESERDSLLWNSHDLHRSSDSWNACPSLCAQVVRRVSSASGPQRTYLDGWSRFRHCSFPRFLPGASITKASTASDYADSRKAGRNVGTAILVYGCHSSEQDALYDQEIAQWEAEGVVSVRYAFSRDAEKSHGCKHVQ